MANEFESAYAEYAKKTGNNPNPDDTQHYYDYRAAFEAGELTPDGDGHLSSKFKKEGHPRLYKHPTADEFSATPQSGWIDTRSGNPSYSNLGGVEEILDINKRKQQYLDDLELKKQNAQSDFDSYVRDTSGEPLDMSRVEQYKSQVEPWRFEQSLYGMQEEHFNARTPEAANANMRFTPVLDEYLLNNPEAFANLDAKQNRDANLAWADREESHHYPVFSGDKRGEFKDLNDDDYQVFAVAGYISESSDLGFNDVVDNIDVFASKYAAENNLTSPDVSAVFNHIKGNLTERKTARDTDKANWQSGISSVLKGLSANEALANSVDDKGGKVTTAARSSFMNEFGTELPKAREFFDKFAAGGDKSERFIKNLEERDFIGMITDPLKTPKQMKDAVTELVLMPQEQRRKTLALMWMMAEDEAGELEEGKHGESFMRGLDSYVKNIDDALDAPVEGLTRDADLTRGKREMHQDLRDMRDMVAEIKGSNKVVQGIYDAERSLPYMIAAAIPYGGLILNAASMATDNDIKLRRLYPEMDEADRWNISMAAGTVQSGIERLSFIAWMKGFPSASKFLAGKGIAGKVGMFGVRAAGIIIIENLEESLQSGTLPVMQEYIWGAFADDIPEVTEADWEESLFIYDEKTFFAVLPLAVMGAGGRTAYEAIGASRANEMLSDVDRVMLHGFSEQEAQAIASESDSIKKWLMFKEGSDAKTKEERKEMSEKAVEDGALDRVLEKDEAQAFEAYERDINENGTEEDKVKLEVQTMSRDYSKKYDAQIKQEGEQFSVVFPEGKPTQTFDTKEEADSAVQAHHVEVNESYLEALSSASANVQAMALQKNVLEKKQEGAEVEIGVPIVGLKEFAEKSEANMKQALERIEHELLKTGEIRPATTADLEKWHTRGQVKLKKDARGYVARLTEGANIADLVEEGSEGFMRDLIDNGMIEEKWVKEQIFRYQEETGNRLTTSESADQMTYQQMVEAFSDLAVSNFYNAHQQDKTGKLGAIINALRIFFAKVAKIAEDLMVLQKEGKIDADFQTLLDNSVGLNMDDQIDRQTKEAQKEILGGAEGKSLSVNPAMTAEEKRVGEGADTEAGTPAPDSPAETIKPDDSKPEIDWSDPSYSISPKNLPEAFPLMTEDLANQILSETDTTSAIHIDRMRVGEFEGISLQGGMFYPSIVENLKARIAWAFNSVGVARTVVDRAALHGGYVKLVLMTKGNVVGNKTFANIWLNRMDNILNTDEKKAEFMAEFHKVRIAAIKSTVSKQRRAEKLKAEKDIAAGKKPAEPADEMKIATYHRGGESITSYDQVRKFILDMGQSDRGSYYLTRGTQGKATSTRAKGETIYGKLLGAQLSTKRGYPDAKEIVEAIEEPAFKGMKKGDVVGLIKLDAIEKGSPIQTAQEAGVTEHLSYGYVVKGKPVAKMKNIHNIEEMYPSISGQMMSQQNKSYDAKKHITFSIAPAFYSKMEGVLDKKIQGKQATPEQIKAIIDPSKGSGVKAEEIKWTGIRTKVDELAAENNGKVPKAELMEWLKNDAAVQFEEVVMGDGGNKQWTQADIDSLEQEARRTRNFDAYEQAVLEYEDQQLGTNANDTGNETQYAEYQLPNGENYKETVVTMPPREKSESVMDSWTLQKAKDYLADQMELEGFTIEYQNTTGEKYTNLNVWNIDKDQRGTLDELSPRVQELWAEFEIKNDSLVGYLDTKPSEGYKSSHFPDIPNYVAHMRTNERQDSTGARGLLSEEYQSDLHQAARKQGYNTPRGVEVAAKELTAALNKNSEKEGLKPLSKPLTPSEAQEMLLRKAQFDWVAERIGEDEATRLAELARQDLNSVPDAPFRKDWSLQLFKRQLRDAVASGLDWVGWTTGQTQNERYDLSKQVDYLLTKKNDDGSYQISAQTQGRGTIIGASIKESELESQVGKEVASKIINGKGVDTNLGGNSASQPRDVWKKLEGNDLKVGGSGMKGFYDNMLPNTVGKYVKQWGARVEDGSVVTDATYDQDAEDLLADLEDRDADTVSKTKTTKIHKVKITDAMRESVKTLGQASFSLAPAEDSVMEKINALMRDPDSRIEIYKDMASRLRKVRERIYKKQIAYGGVTAESMREASKEMNDREFIIASVAQIQAITNVLPMEVRGKVGSLKSLMEKETIKGANSEMIKKIDKIDNILDRYISDHYLNKLNKSRKQGKLKLGKNQKIAQGTITPIKHNEFDLIDDVLEMTDAQVDQKMIENEATLTDPNTEEAAGIDAVVNIIRLQTYGKLLREDKRPQANAIAMKEASDQLSKLIADGRAAYAVLQEEKKARRSAMKAEMIDVVSGGKGVPDSDTKSRMKTKRKKQVVRNLVLEQKAKMNSFEHLIEHLSRLDPSPSMQSRIRAWTEKAHVATQSEAQAANSKQVLFEKAVAEIYGVDTKKKNWYTKTLPFFERISDRVERNIGKTYANSKQVVSVKPEHANEIVAGLNNKILVKEGLVAVTEADIVALKEQMELHPRAKSFKFARQEHKNIKSVYLSVDDIINLTMIYGQEGYRDLMHFHGYSQEVMNQLEGELSEQDKQVRAYMLDYNDKNYDYFNNVYAKIFGVNMRKVKNYSKASFEHQGIQPVEMMDANGATAMSVTPSAGMARIQHLAEPKQDSGAIPLFLEGIRETEHFVAWGELVGDMRSTFLNKDTQDTISAYHGDAVRIQINESIKEFTQGGVVVSPNNRHKMLDKLRTDFTVMSLAYKWGIVVKQWTSLPAYASHIPLVDYVKYQAEFFTSTDNFTKMKNLPYTKHRFEKGHDRDVMIVLNHSQKRSTLERFADWGMKGVSIGDITPVIVGGYAAYRHGYEQAKRANPKAGEKHFEARGVLAFEMLTDNAQQAGNLKDMSGFAKGGSLARVLTMYSTSLIQYTNNETTAIMDVISGKVDSKKKLAKIAFINHVMLPSAFYWVSWFTSNLFKSEDDEEKAKDAINGWIASMILGPFSGVFVFGKALSSAATGYSYDMPVLASIEAATRAGNKMWRMMSDEDPITPDDFLEALDHTADAVSYLRGKGLGKAYEISKSMAKSFGFDRNDARRLAMSEVDRAVYDLRKLRNAIYEEPMPDKEDKRAYRKAEKERWSSLADEYSYVKDQHKDSWKEISEKLKEKNLLPEKVERQIR